MQNKLAFPRLFTREQWLNAMAEEFRAIFFNGTFAPELPDCRYSCGWPKGRAKAIGQCFAAESSADHHFEIFISPELDDACRVGDVLLHECIHAVVGLECKHRGKFRSTSIKCGLTGDMKATVASDELKARLETLVEKIGPYPHAQLVAASQRKKEGTRMKKLVCPNCGCIVRGSEKSLGIPKLCLCQFLDRDPGESVTVGDLLALAMTRDDDTDGETEELTAAAVRYQNLSQESEKTNG
jgi:hypothetical protein